MNFEDIIEWLLNNANWLFDGIGATLVVSLLGVLGFLLKSFLQRYSRKKSHSHGDEEAKTKILITKENFHESYFPSEIPNYPDKLKEVVTENRADELREALTYLRSYRILLISGVAGVGKSTLVRALIDLRPRTVPEPFWFSFYMNKDAKLEDILEKLATFLDAPEIVSFKAEKREPRNTDVNRLTEELSRRKEVWLIFDDLSMMLDDQHFADKGIELFFSSLRSNTHNAKVIITSRILPILENGESLIDVSNREEKQHLGGLRTDFAIDYLANNGLDIFGQQNLEKLVTEVDGHPLALKLLVELVKMYGLDDILDNLNVYQQKKEDTIKKARKLFNKLAGDEKELLERISVYREPVKREAIKEMFTEETPKNAIEKLIDKSLLESDHKGKYWLHPLVQEFSYEDLKNKKEAHMNAYNYYKSLDLTENPTKKEDFQSAIEAYYHACEAGEYDLAADIISISNLHNLLDLWGYPRTLIEIYDKLLPNDQIKGDPILKDKQTHLSILGSQGNLYSYLGEPKKAIEYYEQALKISREIGDRRNEGNQLGNMGIAYCQLGESKKAIEYYEQALKISREIGDRRNEGNWLGNLGTAYIGESKKAIEYYEQALKISREIGDRRNEGNQLGNIGLAYYYLGEHKKAIEYYKQALIIDREIRDKRGGGVDLGNIGLAYNDLGEHKKAIEYYKQALKIFREVGDRRNEGIQLGYMGSSYSDLGEHKKAIKYYEHSLEIFREVGDRNGEDADLGNIGLTYYYLGESKKAIEYYEQALKISREIGDRRNEGRFLGDLGLACSDLGEHKKAIEFFKKSFAIGREIEDPMIINLCEQKLKDLKGFNE